MKILLEPLTKKETHYMNLQGHGARIIEQSGGQCARLLSDFYHMQMEEQDIADTLARYGKYTGYVHLADGVKRTEPGSLPFDYRPGFKARQEGRLLRLAHRGIERLRRSRRGPSAGTEVRPAPMAGSLNRFLHFASFPAMLTHAGHGPACVLCLPTTLQATKRPPP